MRVYSILNAKCAVSKFLYVFIYSISDAPEVTFEHVPRSDIQEGVDTVKVECVASANPSATVYWKKADSYQHYPNEVIKCVY